MMDGVQQAVARRGDLTPPAAMMHPGSPRRFDRESAAFCAMLSRRVYDQDWIDALARTHPDIETHFLSKGPTQAVVLIWQEVAVVVFRGTDGDFEDIRANLRFRREDLERGDPGFLGEVHGGFLAAYNAVAPDLRAIVSNAWDRPVTLTGHSQGGALAVIAARVLHANGAGPVTTYTFGAPRVGDASFASFSRLSAWPPHFRVEHAADIVPMLPFLAMGFRHGGERIFLSATGPIDPAPPAWRVWLSRVARVARCAMKSRGLHRLVPRVLYTDHRIAAYEERLKAPFAGDGPGEGSA